MEQGESRHQIQLCDRSSASLTGVVDVLSFDTEMILLETTQGMLTIKGKDLHVGRLCLEKGEVDLEGNYHLIQYTESKESAKRKKENLLKRLFQ